MKKKLLVLAFFIFALPITFRAISIWDDRRADIYSKKINYNVGDSVVVLITEESSYEYRSTGKGLKSYKVDIRGGEAKGIFDFIPTGSSEENLALNERDSLKVKNIIAARIVALNNNIATIQGIKNVSVNNRVSNIAIRGEVNISDIKDNQILSSKLLNSTVTITTLLENSKTVISNRDIQEVPVNPDSTTDTRTTNRLSKEKERELLLQYFNKILNTIF